MPSLLTSVPSSDAAVRSLDRARRALPSGHHVNAISEHKPAHVVLTFSAASALFSDCSKLSVVCFDIRLFALLSFCSVRAAVRIFISL